MEWGGDNCISIISNVIAEPSFTGKVYISPNDSEAARQLTTFFEQFKVNI